MVGFYTRFHPLPDSYRDWCLIYVGNTGVLFVRYIYVIRTSTHTVLIFLVWFCSGSFLFWSESSWHFHLVGVVFSLKYTPYLFMLQGRCLHKFVCGRFWIILTFSSCWGCLFEIYTIPIHVTGKVFTQVCLWKILNHPDIFILLGLSLWNIHHTYSCYR